MYFSIYVHLEKWILSWALFQVKYVEVYRSVKGVGLWIVKQIRQISHIGLHE